MQRDVQAQTSEDLLDSALLAYLRALQSWTRLPVNTLSVFNKHFKIRQYELHGNGRSGNNVASSAIAIIAIETQEENALA